MDKRDVMNNSFSDDLSANKIAQQYKTPSGCLTCYAANNSVDRNMNTCSRAEDIGTTGTEKSTWWHVDLGSRHNVYNIRIKFKDYSGFSKYSINIYVE